jgi:hypothetical protein
MEWKLIHEPDIRIGHSNDMDLAYHKLTEPQAEQTNTDQRSPGPVQTFQ